MGYGFYEIWSGGEKRAAGYMVRATCDKFGCDVVIDRGLGYLCGDEPHDLYDGEPGCGRYYCEDHLGWVGERGGCDHRRKTKHLGRTLSDLVPNPDGSIVCLDPLGHVGPHAWEVEANL